MIYCSQCQAPNPEGSAFCGSCGARLAPSALDSPVGSAASAVRRLRPLGVGDILDETIRLYRHNFRTFVAIVAVLQVPVVVLQMLQLAIIGGPTNPLLGSSAATEFALGSFVFSLLSTLVFGAVAWLVYLAIQAALIGAVAERYLGRRVTIGQSYGVARACFWRLFGAVLFLGVVLTLLFMTIIGIPFAIYLGIRWSLALPAIVLERNRVMQSLSRSRYLVQGNWWRVFGIWIVTFIAQYLAAAIPAGVISGIVMLGAVVLMQVELLLLFTALSTAVGAIFGILAMPLLPTVVVLLYYDLRVRKEGFDLEMRAEELGRGQPQLAEGQG